MHDIYHCISVTFILANIPSFKMNASSWRKAVDWVAQGTQANQQVQVAAMTESNQLESLPLSALSADDSGQPQVIYGSEQPLTTSTPGETSTSIPEMQTTETYHQIIPGMSDCLYPTLVVDGLLSTHEADNCGMLQNQIMSQIDKYIQEAMERCQRDINYFDGRHMATNMSGLQQKENFVEQDEEQDEVRIPESNGHDIGGRAHIIQNLIFNIKMSWKPLQKKKNMKTPKWQKNKMSMIYTW